MKAVILAAGRGERLSPLTDWIPKPLLKLDGKPLIGYVLEAFVEAGVDDFIIVTGHLGDHLRKGVEALHLEAEILFIHNPDYRLGNASSLLAARDALAGERHFLLSMSDHIIESHLVEAALKASGDDPLLCVDASPRYLRDVKEATKVLVDGEGYIRRIGKELRLWNGVDTGVFLLTSGIFDALPRGWVPPSLSHWMRRLIREDVLKACDVSGCFWLDVDTWDDLSWARKVLRDGEG
ncbi:MAG: Nucleotidyltransferase family protein [Candidatus Bathyarchaeota archaeon B23]|nr:MAG: Nucleotidyltransferase family protein [Candidatus Bathyarchaeota archaeon B23]